MSEKAFFAFGTSAQVPTRERNHNGYFLRWGAEGILFDPGEGTQRHLIYSGISVSQITKICITHFHGDHCLGLPGILQRISLDRVEHEVSIYYPASGQTYIENIQAISIFDNHARIRLCPIEEEGNIFESELMEISVRRLSHPVETFGYRVSSKTTYTLDPEKLEEYGIKGELIGTLKANGFVEINNKQITVEDVGLPKKGTVFAFVMDTSLCDEAYALAQNADLLVCESTYLKSEQKEAEERGHMTAGQAAMLANKASVGKVALSHFSQRHPDINDYLNEALEYHSNVEALKDGDVIPFSVKRRQI